MTNLCSLDAKQPECRTTASYQTTALSPKIFSPNAAAAAFEGRGKGIKGKREGQVFIPGSLKRYFYSQESSPIL